MVEHSMEELREMDEKELSPTRSGITRELFYIIDLQDEEISHLRKLCNGYSAERKQQAAEIEKLEELILQGEDFIEEEWETVRSFGVLRAKQWYGGMMVEIAKIKAAQPQKGQDNEND